MAKPFKLLREKMKPETRERAEKRAAEILQQMDLQELRQREAALTQEKLAGVLGISQPAVSKLEASKDMLVSTLATYVRAIGGHLDIRVRVDGEEVRLTQFDSVARELKEKLAAH